jgi:hypothetical protein
LRLPETPGRHVGPALEDVRNVDLVSAETHRLDDLGEELAGASDKWLSLLVFIFSWRLTHEHQLSLGIAHAKDDLGAGFHEIGTLCAAEDRVAH